VIKFCSEYLFPRYKFLEKGWIVHDPEKENRFSMLKRKTADGKLVKPLYTSGKGVKRVYDIGQQFT
jgi:hypothetical protein